MPRNAHATTMPVMCAASFSIAIRRLPNGAAATMSMLPRPASDARVPDRATMDQSPVIRAKNGPYFQERKPPRVPIFTGLLVRPLNDAGMESTKPDRSRRDAGVGYAEAMA